MSGPKVKWTRDDDQELRRAYSIADHLRASAATRKLATRKGIVLERCHGRARTLGLTRVCRANRDWTQAEIENLEQYAGKMPASRIAKILGRSKFAIDVRLSHMRLSSVVKDRGYTRGELAEVMGLDLRTLRMLLSRYPIISGLFGNVFPNEMHLWLWDNLEHVDLRKMDQTWLKATLRGRR